MKGFLSYECTLGYFSNVGESLALLKGASIIPEAINFFILVKTFEGDLQNLVEYSYFYQLFVSLVETLKLIREFNERNLAS